jgi:hypothetical protein
MTLQQIHQMFTKRAKDRPGFGKYWGSEFTDSNTNGYCRYYEPTMDVEERVNSIVQECARLFPFFRNYCKHYDTDVTLTEYTDLILEINRAEILGLEDELIGLLAAKGCKAEHENTNSHDIAWAVGDKKYRVEVKSYPPVSFYDDNDGYDFRCWKTGDCWLYKTAKGETYPLEHMIDVWGA